MQLNPTWCTQPMSFGNTGYFIPSKNPMSEDGQKAVAHSRPGSEKKVPYGTWPLSVGILRNQRVASKNEIQYGKHAKQGTLICPCLSLAFCLF